MSPEMRWPATKTSIVAVQNCSGLLLESDESQACSVGLVNGQIWRRRVFCHCQFLQSMGSKGLLSCPIGGRILWTKHTPSLVELGSHKHKKYKKNTFFPEEGSPEKVNLPPPFWCLDLSQACQQKKQKSNPSRDPVPLSPLHIVRCLPTFTICVLNGPQEAPPPPPPKHSILLY